MKTQQCPKCKKENNISNKFCIYCGTKISVQKTKDYENVLHSFEGVAVALLAKVAKSDGNINRAEATYMSTVYDRFCKDAAKPMEARDTFKQILVEEKDGLSNVFILCKTLLELKISSNRKLELISMLVTLAFADDDYSTKEENLIVKVVSYLEIDYSEYRGIVERFIPKEKNHNTNKSKTFYLTIDECYEALKVRKTCSDTELKKSYRSLVKQYHSDILKGKDLPEDLIAFAEEKLKTLNFAYEKLSKYRRT